jgi:hypothetical protein
MGVGEVKEDFQWCPHCIKGGGGCGIYPNRPAPCRNFRCGWLSSKQIRDHWFPKTAKIIIDFKLDGEDAYVVFIVDPDYPTRWREEPWFSDIRKLALEGVTKGNLLGVNWTTVVSIKGERFVVGP